MNKYYFFIYNVMLENNFKFFTIQAHKNKDWEKCTLWAEVVRRFIRSTKFKTPFELELLAISLIKLAENSEIKSVSFELSEEISKPGPQTLDVSPGTEKEAQGFSDFDKSKRDCGASGSAEVRLGDIEDKKADDWSIKLLEDLFNTSDVSSRSNESSTLGKEVDDKDVEELNRLFQLAASLFSDECYSTEVKNYKRKTTSKSELQEKKRGQSLQDKLEYRSEEPIFSLLNCCSSEESDRSVTRETRNEKNIENQFNSAKNEQNMFLNSSKSCSNDASRLNMWEDKNLAESLMLDEEKKEVKSTIGEEGSSSSGCDVTEKSVKMNSKIYECMNVQSVTKKLLRMEMERSLRLKKREKLMKKLYEDTNHGSKLVLDFDPDSKQELVVVDEHLSKHLKRHQREGVRFMWGCCIESLKRVEKEKGSGCVLAHYAGLGKTLQVITFVHSVLSHSVHLRTVLIVCSFFALKNWFHEFKLWMTGCNKPIEPFSVDGMIHKKLSQIQRWMEKGGVLIISYETFRLLIKDYFSMYKGSLLDPGPDIVICDEGHLIANPNNELSKYVSRMRTLRRIILTGAPLENNLIQYYHMVHFVKPNILGVKKEFMRRFVYPITKGQSEKSSKKDVLIMKKRSCFLLSLLETFVQRFGYEVFESFLPEKKEFVISVALTETQEKMYRQGVRQPLKEDRGLLKDFYWFHKIWTHPYVVKRYFDRKKIDSELWKSWEKFILDHEYESIRSSNKLLLLFVILKKCHQIGEKVLVFSHSLYTLELIENFLLVSNSDYTKDEHTEFADRWVLGQDYFKVTGSTKPEDCDIYSEKFSSNHRARLFLISTKTWRLKINLVVANRIVFFDSWNPTQDLRSIFRVYRFGQQRPCFIYRFLAAFTMEEKIYERQKTTLFPSYRVLSDRQVERRYSSDNSEELYTYNPLPKSKWKLLKIPKDQVFAEILSNNRDVIVDYYESNSLLESVKEKEPRAAWNNLEEENTSSQEISFDEGSQSLPLEIKDKCKNKVSSKGRQYQNEISEKNMTLESSANWGLKALGFIPYPDEEMEIYCKRLKDSFSSVLYGI